MDSDRENLEQISAFSSSNETVRFENLYSEF